MFVYIGSGGYGRRGSRTVVDRTFAGQRESVFGHQEIRTAEPESRTFLDVDDLMLFESKFFGAFGRKVDVRSNLDIGYLGIGQSSDQFIRIIHFCIFNNLERAVRRRGLCSFDCLVALGHKVRTGSFGRIVGGIEILEGTARHHDRSLASLTVGVITIEQEAVGVSIRLGLDNAERTALDFGLAFMNINRRNISNENTVFDNQGSSVLHVARVTIVILTLYRAVLDGKRSSTDGEQRPVVSGPHICFVRNRMPVQVDLDRFAGFHNQRRLDRHVFRQGNAAAVGQCGTQFGVVVDDVGLVELRIDRHVERTLFGQQITRYHGAVVAADRNILEVAVGRNFDRAVEECHRKIGQRSLLNGRPDIVDRQIAIGAEYVGGIFHRIRRCADLAFSGVERSRNGRESHFNLRRLQIGGGNRSHVERFDVQLTERTTQGNVFRKSSLYLVVE